MHYWFWRTHLVSFNPQEQNHLFFLGILLVPMKKLFMSKKTIRTLEWHMSSLSWLQASTNPKEHLDHVPWEHLQILQLKELTDAKSAHQVTSSSSSFRRNSERRCDMHASNITGFVFISVCDLKVLVGNWALMSRCSFKTQTLLSH